MNGSKSIRDAIRLIRQELPDLSQHLTQIAEPKVTRDELRGVAGQERLPRIGHLLHTRRQTDRDSLGGIIHPEIVTDLPTTTSPELRPIRTGKPEPRSSRISSA